MESPSSVSINGQADVCEVKVRNFSLSPIVQQNVWALDVPVHDTVVVKEEQGLVSGKASSTTRRLKCRLRTTKPSGRMGTDRAEAVAVLERTTAVALVDTRTTTTTDTELEERFCSETRGGQISGWQRRRKGDSKCCPPEKREVLRMVPDRVRLGPTSTR